MRIEPTCDDQPRVTVVVTCYNQAHLVVEALDSVARQTERAVQLIVTDDGSADDSVVVIERWLRLNAPRFPHGAAFEASSSNVGLPASLNRTLPLVRGTYFVVLNGDDWMDDGRLAAQADALDIAPERVGFSYCDLRYHDEAGVPLVEQPAAHHGGAEGDVLLRMATDTFIGMPGVMVRTAVFERVGPWDESLVADDFDFVMRVASCFEARYLPQALVNYRTVSVSMTNSRRAELAESRARSLTRFLGRSSELDAVILRRLEEQVVMLHGSSIEGRVVRRHVRQQFARRPTRRLARVVVESHLRLPPRSLAFGALRPRLRAARGK